MVLIVTARGRGFNHETVFHAGEYWIGYSRPPRERRSGFSKIPVLARKQQTASRTGSPISFSQIYRLSKFLGRKPRQR